MSSKTLAALSEALAAHISDECDGALVGAWVFVAETLPIEPEENVGTMHTESEGSIWACRGLLEAKIDQISKSGEDVSD